MRIVPRSPFPVLRSSESDSRKEAEPTHAERGTGNAERLFPRPKSLWQGLQLPFTWSAIALVRLYQLGISPGLPSSCRFAPSCSQYMLEAVQRHHALKGILLGTWRLLRCHPWHPGGHDPVP